MAVISKELFNTIARDESCEHVLHPNWGCVDSGLFVFGQSIQGVFKFYVSIYILELLINHKKINKEYLKKQLINFMKSWAYGITMSVTLFSGTCFCRRIIGRFYYYTSILLPGFLSGMSIFFESSRMRTMNTILMSTLALECGVNYLKGQDLIRNSIVTDTSFFMVTNALFMYLYKTNVFANKATLFWFFDPRPKKDDKKNGSLLPCCDGQHKCYKHILKDSTKYFGTGYAFLLIKGLLSKFQKLVNNPLHIISMILNKKAVYNGLFFGSYVFIYKAICRFLYELEGEDKDVHCLLAGLAAGISYSINPIIQMNLLPSILTLQLLWINLSEKYKIPKWCFSELWFASCLATLFHFRFFKPNYTPEYVKKIVTMAVNTKGDFFINNVINYFEYKIKQSRMPITKYMYMTR